MPTWERASSETGVGRCPDFSNCFLSHGCLSEAKTIATLGADVRLSPGDLVTRSLCHESVTGPVDVLTLSAGIVCIRG